MYICISKAVLFRSLKEFWSFDNLNPGIQDFFIVDTLSHVSSGSFDYLQSRIRRMASLPITVSTENLRGKL